MSELPSSNILSQEHLREACPGSKLVITSLNMLTGDTSSYTFVKPADPALTWKADWFYQGPKGTPLTPIEFMSDNGGGIACGVEASVVIIDITRRLPENEDPAMPTPEDYGIIQLANEIKEGFVATDPHSTAVPFYWRRTADVLPLGQVLEFSLLDPAKELITETEAFLAELSGN